jgi:transcriptional regulator
MYRPPAFAVDDPTAVLATLRRVAFGHLVTVDDTGEPRSTPVPFTVDEGVTELRAHVARSNPHWRSIDGARALLIVAGVDAYVSPRWYPTKHDDPRVVPTWNYEVVHLRGTVRVVDDPGRKRAIVEALTDANEASTSASSDGETWAVADAPDDYVERMVGAIVGLEVAVDEVTAKRKLSQNRSEDDRAGVRSGLSRSADLRAVATGLAMGGLDPDPPRPG